MVGGWAAVLLGHGGWKLGEANGLLAEVGVQLGQELLGQVCGGILGAVDAAIVADELLPSHLLLYLCRQNICQIGAIARSRKVAKSGAFANFLEPPK